MLRGEEKTGAETLPQPSGGIFMLKTTLIAASLAFAAISPALAQDMMKCDDTSMMKAEADINAMADATMEQKDMAMKEMAMAKEAMAAKDMEKCSMHMDMAMKAMKKM
jgi:hypothetical protein